MSRPSYLVRAGQHDATLARDGSDRAASIREALKSLRAVTELPRLYTHTVDSAEPHLLVYASAADRKRDASGAAPHLAIASIRRA